VSFVRKDRLGGGIPKGYFAGAPDLAVEVVSPTDSHREVAEKVNGWLAHGAASVWVADPGKMTMDVHHAGSERVSFSITQLLVDERVLPGFSLDLRKVFHLP
jgi:Uma2 family endonuclease